jgi:hypothetical protein
LTTVVAIVEGDGEVLAVPALLRRLGAWRTPERTVAIAPPIRVRRDRFIRRDEEFRRFMLLAAAKCGNDGWILILLDADDECPAELGASLLSRAREIAGHRRVSVVLANREFEAWFIAAAQSLDGVRGLAVTAEDLLADPELPRNAKGWVNDRMTRRSYGETADQAAFASQMDLQQAFERSRSFRKLCDEWSRQATS